MKELFLKDWHPMPKDEEPARGANPIASASNHTGEPKALCGEDKSLDGLVSWLLDNGAIINKVIKKKIAGPLLSGLVLIIGSGRGLFASADVEEGETLIYIPANCLVNLGTLGDLHSKYPEFDSLSQPADYSVKGLSAHQQLTIFLLFESWNRKRSWWKGYIASLPQLSEFKGMPLL